MLKAIEHPYAVSRNSVTRKQFHRPERPDPSDCVEASIIDLI